MSLVVKNVLGELTLRDVCDSILDKTFALYVVSDVRTSWAGGLGWHKTFSTHLASDCKRFSDYLMIQATQSGGVWHGEHEIRLDSKVRVYPTYIEIIERNAKIKIEFVQADIMKLDYFLPRS